MEHKLCTLKDVFNTQLKEQISWKRFVLPVALKNTNEHDVNGDKLFNTVDYVFVDGCKRFFNFRNRTQKHGVKPTDYAIANGPYREFSSFEKYRNQTIPTWRRTIPSIFESGKYGYIAGQYDHNFGNMDVGIVPAMHLNIDAVLQAQKATGHFGKINHVMDEKGKVLYHTINFGDYPQNKVNNDYKFDELLKLGLMVPTGKKYTGYFCQNGETPFAENLEYEYQGQRYVYVNVYDKCRDLADWHPYQTHGFDLLCFQVQPIAWVIRNWHEMPQVINPSGNGKAKFMDVRAEKVMMAGIPFHLSQKNQNCTTWKDSLVRSLLNGGISASGGFLQQAFGDVGVLTREQEPSYKNQYNQIQPQQSINEAEINL